MAELKEFTKKKDVDFPHEGELANRIEALCYEYSGELSVVATIGVLEIVKLKIHNDALSND